MQEIWVAAKSGGFHYKREGGQWVNTRDKSELFAALSDMVSAQAGIALVLNAGPVAKFVLLLLGVFSVVCWALVVEKWWEFRKIRRESGRFLKVFREGRRLSAIFGAANPTPISR